MDTKKVDDLEGLMDLLEASINKYDTLSLSREKRCFVMHMKVRYYKYQHEYHQLTGQYY